MSKKSKEDSVKNKAAAAKKKVLSAKFQVPSKRKDEITD
jgi:hypothetical protein